MLNYEEIGTKYEEIGTKTEMNNIYFIFCTIIVFDGLGVDMKKNEYNYLVKKHENLVTASFVMEANEYKLMNHLISSIRTFESLDINKFDQEEMPQVRDIVFDANGKFTIEKSELPRWVSIEIQVTDFLDFIDSKTKNYEFIEDICDRLLKRTVTFRNPLVKEKWHKSSWVAEIEADNGVLTFYIPIAVYSLFMQLNKGFLAYDKKNISKLTSFYSIRLYEILRDRLNRKKHQNGGKGTLIRIAVDDLRQMMMFPESYQYADIKRVIDNAYRQLKEHTDIGFQKLGKEHQKKRGRKVSEIHFQVFDQPPTAA